MFLFQQLVNEETEIITWCGHGQREGRIRDRNSVNQHKHSSHTQSLLPNTTTYDSFRVKKTAWTCTTSILSAITCNHVYCGRDLAVCACVIETQHSGKIWKMAENASLVRSFVGRQQPCELENGETAHWLSSCLFCSCVQLCVCSCVCVVISVKAYWLLSSRVWACRLCNLSAKNSVAVHVLCVLHEACLGERREHNLCI